MKSPLLHGIRLRRDTLKALLGAGVVLILLQCGTARAASALDPGAEAAARTYLVALLSGDEVTLRALTPARLENKFGPCPFAEMPRFHSPRVDMHRGAVLFVGTSKHPNLPDEGGVTLTMLDAPQPDRWRVRHVAFFKKLPLGFEMPSRSITRADEAQQRLVVKAASEYVAAWLKGDYQRMNDLRYDWLTRDLDPVRGLRVRSIELHGSPSAGGDTKITFKAKVTVFRVLPKTLEGTLYAMREDGRWKIRGNQLLF
jgi:hypothetical protein